MRKISTFVFGHMGRRPKAEMLQEVFDFCVAQSEPTKRDKALLAQGKITSFVPCINCPIHYVCEHTKPASFEELPISDIRALYRAVQKCKYGK